MTDDNASFQSDRKDAMSKDSEEYSDEDKMRGLDFELGPVIDELYFLRHPFWGSNEMWKQAHEKARKRSEKRKRDAERDTQ